MKPCPSQDANRSRCNCTCEPCPRKGRCCACLAYHLAREELPACAFPDDVERTWDRSFRRFASIHGPGGRSG